MIGDIKYDNLLKIGFMNNPVKFKDLIPDYEKSFDILILEDGNFDEINMIIKHIVDEFDEKDDYGVLNYLLKK